MGIGLHQVLEYCSLINLLSRGNIQKRAAILVMKMAIQVTADQGDGIICTVVGA